MFLAMTRLMFNDLRLDWNITQEKRHDLFKSAHETPWLMLCLAPWQYWQCLTDRPAQILLGGIYSMTRKALRPTLTGTNNYNILRIPQGYVWFLLIGFGFYACCNQWHARQSAEESFVKGLEWNTHSTGSYRPGRPPQVMCLLWVSYHRSSLRRDIYALR